MAGATKATASIPIVFDNFSEETEYFNLRLYIDATGYGLGLQSGNIKNATAFIMQPNMTGNFNYLYLHIFKEITHNNFG